MSTGTLAQAQPAEQPSQQSRKKGLSAVPDVMSGIFTQLLPVLIASGMLKAIVNLLTAFHIVNTDGSFYYFLTAEQLRGNFYILSVVLIFSFQV